MDFILKPFFIKSKTAPKKSKDSGGGDFHPLPQKLK
jgi:hypothetical protein